MNNHEDNPHNRLVKCPECRGEKDNCYLCKGSGTVTVIERRRWLHWTPLRRRIKDKYL